MSAAQREVSRETTGERSCSRINPVPLTADFTKMLTKSSPRFGTLSHHSFFSRHNPHPNRVRHIQGLNGRPICSVRDDWFVTSSLFPHPLLKSHVLRRAAQPAFPFPHAQTLHGAQGNQSKPALFSEAWRDELKELAAKVSQTPPAQKETVEAPPEDALVRRQTQYSAATGRLIPPSSQSYLRKSPSRHLKRPQPLQDQELTVLEVLCQILQTDSLSTVQQWLLLAGQREKDLVMGMIRRALDGVDLSGRNPQQHRAFYPSPQTCDSPFNRRWAKTSSRCADQHFAHDKPERIGDAEVLEVHPETPPEDPPVAHANSA